MASSSFPFSLFQSTLPREERRAMARRNHGIIRFQSTLPREERPAATIATCITAINISIHAPTRGATSPGGQMHNQNHISIHAPTRGATHTTPADRVTFQFQSTLPREERPDGCVCSSGDRHFNPRSHERSDRRNAGDLWRWRISIHAPTRGATTGRDGFTLHLSISIHAPTRGATQRRAVTTAALQFQSTLPREERRTIARAAYASIRFQSTLPREERLFRRYARWQSQNFNPRSHERSDLESQ